MSPLNTRSKSIPTPNCQEFATYTKLIHQSLTNTISYNLFALYPTPFFMIQQTPAVRPTPNNRYRAQTSTSPALFNNPYRPVYSFPSAIVPKTTNKTAGRTPYTNLAKRKLEYDTAANLGKKVVRNFNKFKLVSQQNIRNQNTLFYHLLPDGVISAFATKGSPQGATGYMQPAVKAFVRSLKDESSDHDNISAEVDVTAVLPIRDMATGNAKMLRFGKNNENEMTICSLVTVRDKVCDNTEANGNIWCTNLVHLLNKNFNLGITFGGNAARYGSSVRPSLDMEFLTEDVVNLAMMSYQASIEDSSFFDDSDLVSKYFSLTNDPKSLFESH